MTAAAEAAARAATEEAETKRQRGTGWPDPEPLFADGAPPRDYPVGALSPVLRDLVEEYRAFGQQPVALIATSALAATALAVQGLADVSRDGNLIGPSSLAFLNIASSGERKTSCDRVMTRPHRRWLERRREEIAPARAAAHARVTAWQARHDGTVGRIKRLAGSTKVEDEANRRQLEADLATLESERPHEMVAPMLFLEDATPEGLAVALAAGWPSASLWSDEGGLVVGSHAMSEETALRFVALLNRLWDGGSFDRRRSTRDCLSIEGRRLTTSLMVQPLVAGRLLTAGNGVARGTGNLARLLICWPETTMGTRLYRPGNLDGAAFRAFDDRITALLELPLPVRDERTMRLEPPTLELDDAAFAVWAELHDGVEQELAPGGDFAEIADFAAKTGEQAARIAAVLHLFEHGPDGRIDETTMEAAATIAAWHLGEARRVLGMLARSDDDTDAQALLDWLMARREPPTAGDILRLGPYRLRDKGRRDKALARLTDHGLARPEEHGKATVIVVNPALRSQP